MRTQKRLVWSISFLIYVAAIAVLCFMKTDNMPPVRPDLWGIPVDKVAHFMMFFPYPIVAYGVFRGKEKKLMADIAVLAIAYVTGCGLAIGTEHLQGILEYRTYDINDFKADMFGISCSTAMIFIYITITIKQRFK